MITLKTPIVHDKYTEIAERSFDIPHTEYSIVEVNDTISLPEEWNIGLIYGASGVGKSTLLREKFGAYKPFVWDNNISIISNFSMVEPQEASELLCAVGLNTIPCWVRPYNCLSTGEKARADIAIKLALKDDITVIDEFTSVVDRNVAKALSNSVQKYIKKKNIKVVFASCHTDIIEWLLPDWAYNPADNVTKYPRGCLCRPKINLKICRVKYEAWELFKHHHYLSADLNKAAKCFMAYWDDKPVGFIAILPQPSGHFKNGWRISRVVVLPDYQGLGIGIALRNYFGSLVTAKEDGKLYGRTMHPAIGLYGLNHKDIWQETSHSRKKQDKAKGMETYKLDTRPCYAFKYVGKKATEEEAKLFYEKL